MKTGDAVFQLYSGTRRYGKVVEVKENFKNDGWLWAKVDWIDDEKYVNSQKWKAKMRNKEDNYYISEYYRCDDIQKIDLDKSIRTLLKLKDLI